MIGELNQQLIRGIGGSSEKEKGMGLIGMYRGEKSEIFFFLELQMLK
jgi:hypothetical protein